MRVSEAIIRKLRGAAGAGLVIAAGCAGAAGDAAPPSIVPVKHGAAQLIPMSVTVPAPLEVELASTMPVDPGPPQLPAEAEPVDMRDEAASRRKREARIRAQRIAYHHYAIACGRG